MDQHATSKPGDRAPAAGGDIAAATVVVLAPRAERIGAALAVLCLLFSGLDAIDNGARVIGTLCLGGAAFGLGALTARRLRSSFLRWSNFANGALLWTAAVPRLLDGRVALPSLQVVAGVLLIALALFDLPRNRRRATFTSTGIELWLSRLRRRKLPWVQVRYVTADGQSLRIACRDGADLVLKAADEVPAAQLVRIAALRPRASVSDPVAG